MRLLVSLLLSCLRTALTVVSSQIHVALETGTNWLRVSDSRICANLCRERGRRDDGCSCIGSARLGGALGMLIGENYAHRDCILADPYRYPFSPQVHYTLQLRRKRQRRIAVARFPETLMALPQIHWIMQTVLLSLFKPICKRSRILIIPCKYLLKSGQKYHSA